MGFLSSSPLSSTFNNTQNKVPLFSDIHIRQKTFLTLANVGDRMKANPSGDVTLADEVGAGAFEPLPLFVIEAV